MEDFLIGGNGHGLGGLQHPVQIAPGHFAVADRHDARRVAALHVVAGDRGVDRTDFAAGHQLGFLDRALDRLHRRFDVDHHAPLQPARFMRADADHFDRIAGGVLAHQCGDLGGADVETDDQRFVALAIHVGKPRFDIGDWGLGKAENGSARRCTAKGGLATRDPESPISNPGFTAPQLSAKPLV